MEFRGSIFGIHADWQAITLCLIAASTFWFFNAMNDDHTADVSYPIEFVFNEEEIVPVEALPEKIHFNASGFGWNLFRKTLKINRRPVVVDLEEFTNKNYLTANELLPIVKSQLDDIKVNYLLQDTVYLKFDRVTSRLFPIRVDSSEINLVPGYKITTPVKIEPNLILVTGPAGIVGNLKDSFFINIPERNIENDYEENISLTFELPDLVEIEPDEVEVAFGVAEFVQETINVQLNIEGGGADSTLLPADKTVKLTVLVKPEDIEKLRDESLKAVLDYNELSPGDSTVPVQLSHKPDYVSEYFFTPSSVKITRD